MGKRESFNKLQVSLQEAIEAWSREVCENQEWEAVSYVGNDASALMAKAAIAVLEAIADVQEFLVKEGHME